MDNNAPWRVLMFFVFYFVVLAALAGLIAVTVNWWLRKRGWIK